MQELGQSYITSLQQAKNWFTFSNDLVFSVADNRNLHVRFRIHSWFTRYNAKSNKQEGECMRLSSNKHRYIIRENGNLNKKTYRNILQQGVNVAQVYV